MTKAEALSSIEVIANTERGPDGQAWTHEGQIAAIRSVLTTVDKPAAGRIGVGDWVEVIDAGGLPVGNRYRVTADFGKALELEGLNRLHSAMLFRKVQD